MKARCCKPLTTNDLWPNVQQGHVSSPGSCNILNQPCSQETQLSIRKHTQTHAHRWHGCRLRAEWRGHVAEVTAVCPSACALVGVCVCSRTQVLTCSHPRAASTVLTIQTLLDTKPLPDLSLCRDIWTLVNRSNSTKECWKNGRKLEEKRLGGIRAVSDGKWQRMCLGMWKKKEREKHQ